MKKIDLTTKKGLLDASRFMGIESAPLLLAGELIQKLVKSIFDSDSVKKQGEVLDKLIEKGKKSGVKEMVIKIKNKKGFNFDMPTKDGVTINTLLGSDETMNIRVTYK